MFNTKPRQSALAQPLPKRLPGVGLTCWVRYTHSGNYKARGASGDYEAWGASGGKYEARMVIFRILAAVNRFSRISWKEESR